MPRIGNHTKTKNGRNLNRHDSLAFPLMAPIRGGNEMVNGISVGRGIRARMSKARKEIIAIMEKKIAKASGKVRKIRDRSVAADAGPKKPSTIAELALAVTASAPNAVKDTTLPFSQSIKLPKVPHAPLPGQKVSEWASKKEAEVEILMLRGWTEAREIAKTVGLNERRTNDMMYNVRARWAVTGSAYDIKRGRGEALQYLGRLKREIWEVVGMKGINADQKTYALSLLVRMFGSQLMLEGVTQEAIEDLSHATDETGEVMQRMAKQRGLVQVTSRLMDIVLSMREKQAAARAAKIIDVQPGTDDDDE